MADQLALQAAKDLDKVESVVYVTGATTLTAKQTEVYITTAASVAYDITLPHLDVVPNGTSFYFKVISDGGTGDVTVKSSSGSDVIGDAFSAENDLAKITKHCNAWKVEYETTT